MVGGLYWMECGRLKFQNNMCFCWLFLLENFRFLTQYLKITLKLIKKTLKTTLKKMDNLVEIFKTGKKIFEFSLKDSLGESII